MGTEKGKIKVLVTGGGGFVGMALVSRLVLSGFEVFSFSRKVYDAHKKIGAHSIQGNIVFDSEIEKACVGMEVVFHVAAKVGIWGNYNDFYDVNVRGTQNLISACRKNGVKKLIFTSSASVVFNGSNLNGVDESIEYSNKHLSFYTSTKAKAEKLVLEANSPNLQTIALRPHLIWGPGDTQLIPKLMKRAKSGRLRKIGKGNAVVDTVYIDNFIDAQLQTLGKLADASVNGKPFFITNGEPMPVWDFINSIIVANSYQAVKKSVPKNVILIIAWILEKMHLLFGIKKEPFITRFVVHELCTNHWFSISKAKQLLGYAPRVSIQNGLKRL